MPLHEIRMKFGAKFAEKYANSLCFCFASRKIMAHKTLGFFTGRRSALSGDRHDAGLEQSCKK